MNLCTYKIGEIRNGNSIKPLATAGGHSVEGKWKRSSLYQVTSSCKVTQTPCHIRTKRRVRIKLGKKFLNTIRTNILPVSLVSM